MAVFFAGISGTHLRPGYSVGSGFSGWMFHPVPITRMLHKMVVMYLDFLLGPPVSYLVKSEFVANSIVSGVAAKMSYCMPESKGRQPRGATTCPKVRAVAERSYPHTEVRGPAACRGATPYTRSGGGSGGSLVRWAGGCALLSG